MKDGAEFVFDSPAVQLVKDDSGKVCGCICETSEGYVQYNAAKGVVLATGDIGGSLEMCGSLRPHSLSTASPAASTPFSAGVNTGDGHKMGMWVGAAAGSPFPTMMHPRPSAGSIALPVRKRQRRALHVRGHLGTGKSLAINSSPTARPGRLFDANWPITRERPALRRYVLGPSVPTAAILSWPPEYFKTQIPLYIEQGMGP